MGHNMHTHTHTEAGYTPLMLAADCCVEVGEHRDIKGHLVDRGDINKAADKVRLSLCNTWVTRVIDEFT